MKGRTPALDRRRSLGGIPVLHEGVRLAERDGGKVMLRVPLPARRRGLLNRWLPLNAEKQIALDALGSFVVRQMDGRRTTRQIVEAFATRFGVNRREAELSMVAFLKSLARRRVISIVIR